MDSLGEKKNALKVARGDLPLGREVRANGG